jgi:uncharacterized membrane protein YkgB
MPCCSISCMISAVFLVGMVYFYYMTDKSAIVKHYKSKLSPELQKRYEKISQERRTISYYGYALGLLLSLFILFYYLQIQKVKIGAGALVCVAVATTFLTNYFYYMLSPKSDWMLNHMNSQEEVDAWLQMYRGMQFNYHMGMALGIVAVGIFASAFRC